MQGKGADMESAAHTSRVAIVGAGLAGLVAAAELLDRGISVTIYDQEGPANLGGQAHWSFGGLFLIDSPEQRRLGVQDSRELAGDDWAATAGFDRDEDDDARAWAENYLDFASGEKRAWLHGLGVRFFPVVGWAERGPDRAMGNSVPRFHIVWGTGPGIVAPFAERLQRGIAEGRAHYRPRHRITELLTEDGRVTGLRGERLEADDAPRGEASNRNIIGEFSHHAEAVLIATGGIGGNPALVRAAWPDRLGAPPAAMLAGVPAHVDGAGLAIAERAGAQLVNGERMWHYTEGIINHSPVWNQHGIRILPGPSSLWLDATGRRLPATALPGFDTLGALEELRKTGHDHSWFVLTQKIIEKEFALSGSEQNPDLTNKDFRLLLQRLGSGAPGPVRAFQDHGVDFVSASDPATLAQRMLELDAEGGHGTALDPGAVVSAIRDRDQAFQDPLSSDPQVAAVREARKYLGDKLIRTAAPHALTDPKAGPMIAVRLHLVTRKSLGGIRTAQSGAVRGTEGAVIPGLYAAGEASGFGGGGVHGYRALEGTFLGGCLFTGRTAGRSIADALEPRPGARSGPIQ